MAELLMAIVKAKADIISALRLKSLLWSKGIELSGMVVRSKKDDDDSSVPSEILEEIMQLRLMGKIKI
jgi:hypothetical protein